MWAGNHGIRKQGTGIRAHGCAIVYENQTILHCGIVYEKRTIWRAHRSAFEGLLSIPWLNDFDRLSSWIACDPGNRWTIDKLSDAVRAHFAMESLGLPDDFALAGMEHDSQVPPSCGIACFSKRFASEHWYFSDIVKKSLGIPDDLLMWGLATSSLRGPFAHNRSFLIDDFAEPRNSCFSLQIVCLFRAWAKMTSIYRSEQDANCDIACF